MRNTMTGRCALALLGSVAAVAIVGGASLIDGSMSPAPAQVQTRTSVSVDFHAVLDRHGRWERHSRWGEVWLPGNRPRDWRPYTDGYWAYTEEWGWYWISAQDEEDWGWVAFHYGRWVFDPDLGWMWIFVRDRDCLAPRIVDVILPPREYDVFIRETVVVNRTIVEERERIAINPGIEPEFIAAAVGRPLVPVEVRPPVLAGTVGVSNAVEVRATERQRMQVSVTEKRQASIRPAQNIPPPTPLRAGEKGRLGEHPPTAAREAQQPGTAAPGTAQQPQRHGAPAETRRERPGAPGAAQRPQPPGAPSTAQQPPRPGAPGTAQQPQQPGAPSTAQERKPPGGPEQRRPSAERGLGAAPEQRGQAPPH